MALTTAIFVGESKDWIPDLVAKAKELKVNEGTVHCTHSLKFCITDLSVHVTGSLFSFFQVINLEQILGLLFHQQQRSASVIWYSLVQSKEPR